MIKFKLAHPDLFKFSELTDNLMRITSKLTNSLGHPLTFYMKTVSKSKDVFILTDDGYSFQYGTLVSNHQVLEHLMRRFDPQIRVKDDKIEERASIGQLSTDLARYTNALVMINNADEVLRTLSAQDLKLLLKSKEK